MNTTLLNTLLNTQESESIRAGPVQEYNFVSIISQESGSWEKTRRRTGRAYGESCFDTKAPYEQAATLQSTVCERYMDSGDSR
jgi:hypothetical protein